MSTSWQSFDAFLKQAYSGASGNLLRADGTWIRPEDFETTPVLTGQSAEPEPAPEPLVGDEAPIVVEAAPHGYTRGDLLRMRRIEAHRSALDRGLK